MELTTIVLTLFSVLGAFVIIYAIYVLFGYIMFMKMWNNIFKD